MGQEILKQQQELEERIRGFEEDGKDEVGEGTQDTLHELDDAMRAWESQNEGMIRELGGKVGFALLIYEIMLTSDRYQTAATKRRRR